LQLGTVSIAARAETSIAVAAANLLRPLSMSYDASAGCGDRLPLLCVELTMNAVVEETRVPGRASRRRHSVRVSYSCFAGFQLRSRSGLQLPVETRVLPFCSSHWSHKWPQNYFPLFTQDLCQQARVVYGARWFQDGNGITRPSTVLIGVWVPIKPS
jgi:hypothetical protein